MDSKYSKLTGPANKLDDKDTSEYRKTFLGDTHEVNPIKPFHVILEKDEVINLLGINRKQLKGKFIYAEKTNNHVYVITRVDEDYYECLHVGIHTSAHIYKSNFKMTKVKKGFAIKFNEEVLKNEKN